MKRTPRKIKKNGGLTKRRRKKTKGGEKTYLSDGVSTIEEIKKKIYRINRQDGVIYEGEVSDLNQPHGEGTIIVDGDHYTGTFKSGIIQNGKVHIEYANGDIYDGDLVDGIKNGYGVLVYANGERYAGDWKDGIYHGDGVLEYINGERYDGHWKDGIYHGRGTKNFRNGTKYEGTWKDGKMEKGKFTGLVGNVYNGTWTDKGFTGTMTDTNRSQFSYKNYKHILTGGNRLV